MVSNVILWTNEYLHFTWNGLIALKNECVMSYNYGLGDIGRKDIANTYKRRIEVCIGADHQSSSRLRTIVQYSYFVCCRIK